MVLVIFFEHWVQVNRIILVIGNWIIKLIVADFLLVLVGSIQDLVSCVISWASRSVIFISFSSSSGLSNTGIVPVKASLFLEYQSVPYNTD